jgi:hypothetical protein
VTRIPARPAATGSCRHCGKAIRQDRQGYWGARKRDDSHPWYCDADPGAGKRHEPAREDAGDRWCPECRRLGDDDSRLYRDRAHNVEGAPPEGLEADVCEQGHVRVIEDEEEE